MPIAYGKDKILTSPHRWHADAYSDAVLYHSQLPPKARMLALAYARRALDEHGRRSAAADLTAMTYDMAQQMTGIGRRCDVTRFLHLLVDAGWLQIVRTVHRRPTVYRLTIPDAFQPTTANKADTTSVPGSLPQSIAPTPSHDETAAAQNVQNAPPELPPPTGPTRTAGTGTTVVPFRLRRDSAVGTTVVPTAEPSISNKEHSSSSSRRPLTLAYIADTLTIDDDEAAAVIEQIRRAARQPITSLSAYLRRISAEDLAAHLDELRAGRQMANHQQPAIVLRLNRPTSPAVATTDMPAPETATNWRQLQQANERLMANDPAARARRDAAIARAHATITASSGPRTNQH